MTTHVDVKRRGEPPSASVQSTVRTKLRPFTASLPSLTHLKPSIDAANQAREAGYKKMDAYTPVSGQRPR